MADQPSLAAEQEALHRDGRLPDEPAGQRAGRGQAAQGGLRADRRHQPGRRDPLQHLLGPAARRGQDLQRARADQAAQGAEAGGGDRRAGLHGPEGSGADLPACASRRRGRRARASSPGPRAARAGSAKNDTPQIAVSLARNAGSLEVDHGELRELRRRSRAGDAAQPVPGVRPGDDGLRQVLHLLHRALGPRARAEPAARGDPGRGPRCWPTRGSRRSRSWARPSTATSTASPTAGPAGSPTCSSASTTSTASSGSSSSPTSPTT